MIVDTICCFSSNVTLRKAFIRLNMLDEFQVFDANEIF